MSEQYKTLARRWGPTWDREQHSSDSVEEKLHLATVRMTPDRQCRSLILGKVGDSEKIFPPQQTGRKSARLHPGAFLISFRLHLSNYSVRVDVSAISNILCVSMCLQRVALKQHLQAAINRT
jgi:hypothetical protein